MQNIVYILTNWYLISLIFSDKYWTKVFPFEVILVYYGVFLKIFGGLKFFTTRISLANFAGMVAFIQVWAFFMRKIMNKHNSIIESQTASS